MARKNYGKDWETHFRRDFSRTFPNEFIMRLKDDVSHYKSSSRNPCDFLCHIDGKLYMVEVKCHYGNTFPFSKLGQYWELEEGWGGLKDVRRCVVLWMIDHDLVLIVPISEVTRMMADGLKSINVNTYKEYNIIEPRYSMKRVFPEVDYTSMTGVED